MTARFRWCAALAVFLICNARGEDEPAGSVLVTTQVPRLGTIADVVTAYGTATRAADGGMTISLPADGRVMHVTVAAGEPVRRGQALMEFRLSAASTVAYAQAASAVKLAKLEQERYARLLSQQLATRDQVAQADKALGDAEAALDALDAEQGGHSDQVIVAPFDGVVGAIAVSQGDRVAAGAALITLTRNGGLLVTAGVEPADRGRIRPGQRAHLTPLSSGSPAAGGAVLRVARVLNPKTRLVDVDITPTGEVLQGEVFRADIEAAQLKGWLVPRDAVLSDDDGEYLFQVQDGKAQRVAVKRTGGNDDISVVDGPVDPKRPLVTAGNYQLSDGAALRESDGAPAAPEAAEPPVSSKTKGK